MPSPDRLATNLVNSDLQRENQYNHSNLAALIANIEPLLTAEHKLKIIVIYKKNYINYYNIYK